MFFRLKTYWKSPGNGTLMPVSSPPASRKRSAGYVCCGYEKALADVAGQRMPGGR